MKEESSKLLLTFTAEFPLLNLKSKNFLTRGVTLSLGKTFLTEVLVLNPGKHDSLRSGEAMKVIWCKKSLTWSVLGFLLGGRFSSSRSFAIGWIFLVLF